MDFIVQEEDLALHPLLQVNVSVHHPTGNGSRNPRVLLNADARHLDGQHLSAFNQNLTYDTYDGQNSSTHLDWYILEFPTPTLFNCIEMIMGFPYRDGGWWTSLRVETRTGKDQPWCPVRHLSITPPYNFENIRHGRHPFDMHTFLFDEVEADAVRLIGHPGGIASFTSLAQLAIYRRDLSRWKPVNQPTYPVPRLYQLISADTFWDISRSLVKLAGLEIGLPLLEYYLDKDRREQMWTIAERNYRGQPELWFFLGDNLGWPNWAQIGAIQVISTSNTTYAPSVGLGYHKTMAAAFAPVTIGDQVLAVMGSRMALLKDTFDLNVHRQLAQQYNLSWTAYQAALERTPQLTLAQFHGLAELLGHLSSLIVNQAHHISHESKKPNQAQLQEHVISRAITFMQENLENCIDVAQVSHELGFTPSYFSGLFSKYMGCNPSDYLIRLRIERAKEYLVHKHMSVTHVCDTLGYTPSHFSRLFKRYTGYTPSQYVQHMATSF